MKGRYRAPKGFQDILPPESSLWEFIERSAAEVFQRYGYGEIRVPIVEHTEVFTRSIGEATDIVEKEMYTFLDRADRSLTLRPEGTAPVVRAYVQNGLYSGSAPQKYYYRGPMFRYERPQKGRFRQFFQIGAEAFGVDDPALDAEMLCMLRDFFFMIGIEELTFEVNSIGCPQCRPRFKEALREFFGARKDMLCADCQRRYDTNPLRILDCKVPSCREASEGAPVTVDYLCNACSTHFEMLKKYLEELGIHYDINHRLVRGLDYYTSTTFEITTTRLGSQNAVAAGGRYDRLVEEFGGPSSPAVGFALGVERLAELIAGTERIDVRGPAAFFACLSESAKLKAVSLVHAVREKGFWAEMNYAPASLRNLLKKADKMGAGYAFMLGENEMTEGRVKYRKMDDATEGHFDIDDTDGIVGLLTGNERK